METPHHPPAPQLIQTEHVTCIHKREIYGSLHAGHMGRSLIYGLELENRLLIYPAVLGCAVLCCAGLCCVVVYCAVLVM